MPVSPLHKTVLCLLAENRDEESFLAGATALLAAPNTSRYSHDIDYFHDREERVTKAFNDDRALLQQHGYDVQIIFETKGFIRATISLKDDVTKIEWVHDTSWRFLPVQKHDNFGYVLHPIDNAINKVLALVGREEPRDVLDAIYCHLNILSLGALVWAASGKDPGLSPGMILSMLRRRGRLRPEHLKQIHLAQEMSLSDLKQTWLDALDQAERFVDIRPAEELGCLYYDVNEKSFVTPSSAGDTDIIPHFGRPGGVLPQIADGNEPL